MRPGAGCSLFRPSVLRASGVMVWGARAGPSGSRSAARSPAEEQMNLRPHTLRPTASGWPLVLEGQEEVGGGETEAPPSLPALLPLGQPREGRVPGHKCLDQPSGPEDVLALPSRSHLHTSGPLPAGRPLGLAWSLRTVPARTSHVAEARTAASCSLAGLAGNSFVWHEQGFEKYFQMSFQHFQVGGFYILEDEAFSFALSTRGSGRTEAVFQPAALYGAAAPATALAGGAASSGGSVTSPLGTAARCPHPGRPDSCCC